MRNLPRLYKTRSRGSAHKNLTRDKLSPTKSQKLVRPSLLKILLLCFSNSFDFLLMGVWNWNNPMLTGVEISLFCQFWQQHHVPQIGQCMRCCGTIIGSPVILLCLDLRNTMIEVGTKCFFFLDLPLPSNEAQAAQKTEWQARFLR
jgi:hypothetical protein